VVALTACERAAVAHDISQVQANEVVAILAQNGIKSEVAREGTSKGRFQVEVEKGDFVRAASLLTTKSLPSPARASFESLVSANGFMPASREMEATRLDHALATEVDDLLNAHPAIRTARSVVRLNYLGSSGASGKPEELASIGVIAEVAAEGDQIERLRSELVDIISQIVPAVRRERIAILLQPEIVKVEAISQEDRQRNQLVPFLVWSIPEGDYNGLALTVAGCILAMGLIGGLIGYWMGFYQFSRHNSQLAVNELESGFAKLATGKVSQREREQ